MLVSEDLMLLARRYAAARLEYVRLARVWERLQQAEREAYLRMTDQRETVESIDRAMTDQAGRDL